MIFDIPGEAITAIVGAIPAIALWLRKNRVEYAKDNVEIANAAKEEMLSEVTHDVINLMREEVKRLHAVNTELAKELNSHQLQNIQLTKEIIKMKAQNEQLSVDLVELKEVLGKLHLKIENCGDCQACPYKPEGV